MSACYASNAVLGHRYTVVNKIGIELNKLMEGLRLNSLLTG